MLIDHDAVAPERLIAVAVELLGEKPFGGTERIGGVVYDEVVFVGAAAQEAQAVLVVYFNAFVFQPLRRFGKELSAHVHEHGVCFHDVYALDFRVCAQLLGHAAVAAAYDEHAAHARVHRHGHVHDHFVVYELVLFGEYDVAVQAYEPPEIDGIEHVDLSVIACAAEKLTRHAYVQPDVRSAEIRKPYLHRRPSFI